MLIWFDGTDLVIGLALLYLTVHVLRQRGRGVPYLLFFSIFWIYLMAVAATVIFPIAINNFGGPGSAPHINLIPFNSSYCSTPRLCRIEILGNILLTVPFGFGVSFLVRVRPRQIPWLAIGLGAAFEMAQLILSIAFRSAFRTVDINDVLLNALGVLLGYGLFRGFGRVYSQVAGHFSLQDTWLLGDIYDVIRQAQAAGGVQEGRPR